MKLHVHQGPLPLTAPHFEWDDDVEVEVILEDEEEEIDLTDLLDRPSSPLPN